MHPWTPWIVLASLAAFAGQAAVVYKWTDSDGVIHFSDQPVPGAEKIHTGSGTEAAPPVRSRADVQASSAQNQASDQMAPGLDYTEFSIASPAPDQTFFGDEVIAVSLTLNPPLKQNHFLNWHLNGKQLDDQGPNPTQFTLPRLDRGTYTLAATITDPQSGESRSTDSLTFFVRQPSALAPQRPKL